LPNKNLKPFICFSLFSAATRPRAPSLLYFFFETKATHNAKLSCSSLSQSLFHMQQLQLHHPISNPAMD